MNTGSKFADVELLHQGEHTTVYRARQSDNGAAVILKVSAAGGPSGATSIARLRREYSLLNSLKIPGVVRTLGFEPIDGRWAIVLKDCGGTDLKSPLSGLPLEPPAFLELAIQLVDIVAHLHAKGLIHKDIKPSHIVLDQTGNTVTLIDFAIASILSQEEITAESPNVIEGSLEYMSPEQTGRMNRATDYRTDMYSLGATMYEILTGHPPFVSNDPLELIHCHIARIAPSPSVDNQDIPEAISNIIMKLLAKRAEDRYQSCAGVRADLEECQRQLLDSNSITPFSLGSRDVVETLQISRHLYGREKEIAQLISAFERVTAGNTTMVLVSGAPGIGKSALVNEIHSPVVQTRGYFVSGKFEQFNQNLPYASIILAFRELIRQILGESEQSVQEWRDSFTEAFGPNGQVILDVIPEVELIVGPQPAIPDLPLVESQNRFNLLFQAFARACCHLERPMVLFFDDLQWADSASISLIQLLITEPSARNLMVLGAFRDNEVSMAHPLMKSLQGIEESGVPVEHIRLDKLSVRSVATLIQDTLACSPTEAHELAKLVQAKTDGNPFFVIEFLRTLYQEAFLSFDREQGHWTWDLDRIMRSDITDNVVTLMSERMLKLPAPTQEVLHVAACIGASFDLKTLTQSLNQSPIAVSEKLWPAIQNGLVIPIGSGYKFISDNEDNPLKDASTESAYIGDITYRFPHDRVQQAVMSQVSELTAPQIHLAIGRGILQNSDADNVDENVFQIVNHLNQTIDLITSPTERIDLARMNLAACQRAKGSNAFDPARTYVSAGVSLIQEHDWSDHYQLAHDLFIEKGECDYLTGHHEDAERWFDIVTTRSLSNLEKADVMARKSLFYTYAGKTGLGMVIEGLRLVGVKIPRRPGKISILIEYLKCRWQLRGRDIAGLTNLPPMTDARALAAMSLLVHAHTQGYQEQPELSALAITKMVNLTLRHGNNEHAAFAFSLFGALLCAGMGEYKLGLKTGELALELSRQSGSKLIESRCNFVMMCLINHWSRPARTDIPYAETAFRDALQSGDLWYASISTTWGTRFWIGEPLQSVLAAVNESYTFLVRVKIPLSTHYAVITRQTIRALLGETSGLSDLNSESFNEEQYATLLDEPQMNTARTTYWVMKLQLHFLAGEMHLALERTRAIAKERHTLQGQLVEGEYSFYSALVLAALNNEGTASDRRRLHKMHKQIKKWATNSPENFLHKQLLIEAELQRIKGGTSEAAILYDRAIEEASQHGFLQNKAIAQELAGRFYLAGDQQHVGTIYLAEARRTYATWGATAKVRALEEEFPELQYQMIRSGDSGTNATIGTNPDALDLLSIIKSSHTISSEIVLDRLMEQVMRIVLENAGAERGILLLLKENELLVEASAVAASHEVELLSSQPATESDRIPLSLVTYVERTGESVVLDNAAESGHFTTDPYIVKNKTMSVLCSPIVYQNRLVGVLYLENNLTPAAFVPKSVETISILSSQMASSIVNSWLYTDLAELNTAYERFVPREFLRLLDKPSITNVYLGDQQQKNMTILFVDIRNFTGMSEQMSPKENFDFINDFLKQIGPEVRAYGGFVDKYTGDGIMALFPGSSQNAVESALNIRLKLAQFNSQRRRRGLPSIEIGTGIHTGTLMLGIVGEEARLEGTVISDAVNVAARIEGLTKIYHTPILASEAAIAQVTSEGGFHSRYIDRVKVKGKSALVDIYEVFDESESVSSGLKLQTREGFEQGVRLFHAHKREQATLCFEEVMAKNPSDGAAEYFLQRCRSEIGKLATDEGAEFV
jgi:predicted ATPase/class 3 adenylate cyclase/GAF domain-containing protein/tRNA A-37 threonylcarbamoyl transferase component Bud32